MNSPYTLPGGNVLISFSGGRTSGYMLHKILEANGNLPDRVRVAFANTGREMPETLDFEQQCGERWNVNIDWLEYDRQNGKVAFKKVNHNSASREGEPFDKLINFRQTLPNVTWRYCTVDMKVKTIRRFLIECGWTFWNNTVGIRADEAHRIKRSIDKRCVNWHPLNDAHVSKKDVLKFWSSNDFDLQVIEGGGNCDGCFLKSEATLAAMLKNYPSRMQWWPEAEQRIGNQFHKTRSYVGLKDFVQRQGDWIFDDEAYLCQANEGECTG